MSDPLEAYIASKDPLGDYLASKAAPDSPELDAIGPDSFLRKDTFRPSPQHRRLANTGPMDDVRASLKSNPVRSIPDALAEPVLSTLDRATLGGFRAALRADQEFAGNPIARAVDALPVIGPLIGKRGGETARTLEEGIDEYRSQNPTLSQYTDMPAYFTKGPAALGEGAAELTGQAARALGPTFARAASGMGPASRAAARVGAQSGLTSGAASAMTALSEGAGPEETAQRAGEGTLVGSGLGAGMAAPTAFTGLLADAIINSHGGKARQFLENHGVEVGPGTPGRGGPMDSMVTRGTSDEAIGRQAEVSAKRGLDMLNEEKKAVLGTLGRRIGNIESTPAAAQLQDVSEIVQNMRAAMEELDTTPQARAALGDLVTSIKAKQGQGFNADTDPYLLSEADVNKLRRQLDRYAKTGQSTDAALSPLKSAAGETRAMVDEGPFAEANKDYAKESKHYQHSRKLLGINERPRTPEETQTATNKVKNLITRRGQNTVTAGGQEERLAEFEARHPDIGEEFARPEILRKRADIGFHIFPEHGGLIDRVGPHGAMLLHAIAGLGTGIIPALALTNMPALQARLMYGPALAARAAEPMMLGEVPLVAAARAARREDRP